MRERRSDALPSRMLRAFRGSGRQAKEAKLRDRAVSAEAAMFATNDPLVARPTGRWTEGRVSGTRWAWPQGRRLFLREKHRPRKRQELPFAGDAARAWRSVLLRKHRHPARGSGSVPKGRRIFLRGNRLPGEAAKSVRGWRCLDPASGFLGGRARESKARVGARDRSSGKAAPCKGRGAAPRKAPARQGRRLAQAVQCPARFRCQGPARLQGRQGVSRPDT